MLLICDVVIIVRSLFLFNIKTKTLCIYTTKKLSIYPNRSGLVTIFQSEQHTQNFRKFVHAIVYNDMFNIYIYIYLHTQTT